MRFALAIARRYLRSRKHSRFLSRGSATAIVGITIGVAVLNVTLAIMNGFHAEMRRTFVENMPMVSVITTRPEGFGADLGPVLDRIGADPEVTGLAPFVRQEAILSARLGQGRMRHRGVVVWGVEPDLVDTVQPLSRYLKPDPAILAALDGGAVPRVILGADLANSLYAAIGDTVVLTAPRGDLDPDHLDSESERCRGGGVLRHGHVRVRQPLRLHGPARLAGPVRVPARRRVPDRGQGART